MTYCPNCGKELMDGEICTCTLINNEEIKVENVKADETMIDKTSTEAPADTNAEQAPQAESTPQYTNQPPQPDPNMQYGNQYYVQPPYYQPQQPYYQPVQQPVARTDYPDGYKIKKKYVAVILAYALGVFGIHNFYLGNKSKGITQVILSTVAGMFTLGISTFVVWIWSVVECVQLLTENIDADANGFKIQTLDEAINKKD